MMGDGPSWRDLFDDRQQKEIEFCEVYAEKFAHGSDGHHKFKIIAKLARLLDLVDVLEIDAVIESVKKGETSLDV